MKEKVRNSQEESRQKIKEIVVAMEGKAKKNEGLIGRKEVGK